MSHTPATDNSSAPPRLALVVVLTLILRLLYLLRFGDDELWMNANYLLQARSLFVPPHLISGPPFADFLVMFFRVIGLSGLRTLQAVYLVGHLLFSASPAPSSSSDHDPIADPCCGVAASCFWPISPPPPSSSCRRR